MGKTFRRLFTYSILPLKPLLVLLCLFSAADAFSADYAVTPAGWDDMGAVLTDMAYPYSPITDAELSNSSLIGSYKCIFTNCSANCDAAAPGAKDSIRNFVAAGGAIYSSDWAYIYIQTSFNKEIEFLPSPKTGEAGNYLVSVVDPGLKEYLGVESMTLNLNLGAWVPIASVAAATKEYLRGTNDPLYPDHVRNKPMLASFKYEKGTVVYTTFHNEAQVSATEQRLLEYIVLITITSQLSEELAQYMQNRGYVVAKENLNKISTGQQSILYSYDYSSPGVNYALSFGANFNAGNTMTLSVYRPDGSLYSAVQNATPPILIEVPAAAEGTWTYRVSAANTSSANQPYVLMAGRRTPSTSTLNEVIAAPNPFIPSRGDMVMVFDNVTSKSDLQIFSLTGELLRKIDSSAAQSGSIFWDGKNDDGGNVGSGIYIYLITDEDGNKKKGKVAVVR